MRCWLRWRWFQAELCSERDSPLKRLYRRTHAKLAHMAGSGQLIWAAGCEHSLALIHARRPAWPGKTFETLLRVAPPCKTRPPDHTRVNWPVDTSASGSAQVGPGGRHRWAARIQVGREPARQKAREGYPSHYTSLFQVSMLLGHMVLMMGVALAFFIFPAVDYVISYFVDSVSRHDHFIILPIELWISISELSLWISIIVLWVAKTGFHN